MPPSPKSPTFVTGSIRRHILVMTGTSALGLMAIFAGDLANLIFLGLLGDTEVLAAVGYASTVTFFTISIGIGLSIAATSVVAPAIGAGRRDDARRLSINAMLITVLVSGAIGLGILPFLTPLLARLGANGRALSLAVEFLHILMPSFPLLAIGMTASALLRATGDARRAMYVTLATAVICFILDPIFIFVLKGGIVGAAWANMLSRVATMAVGLHGVIRAHKLLQWPSLSSLLRDVLPVARVAVPAVLTNLATPAGNAFVTAALAKHGDDAVAAWSVIGRINPVAFGAIFAMSGSIGAIVGQNFGAGQFDRVRTAINEAAGITSVFTLMAWAGLWLMKDVIISGFGLTGESAELVALSCRWLPPFFLFLGFLFVANAIFNTLGFAQYATALNWGRATLGTLPFVAAGDAVAGARGIFTGSVAGGVIFGLIGLWLAFGILDRLAAERGPEPARKN